MPTEFRAGTSRAKCNYVTAVWGPRHVQSFIDLNVPSLLADGNVPAFGDQIDTTYVIYTPERDRLIIEGSSALRRLRQFIRVEFRELSASDIGAPIDTHNRIWRQGIEDAIAAETFILFMPPDVIWSNGSLAHLASLISAGKHAIFANWHVRVVSESFIPAFQLNHRRDEDDSIAVDARSLVRLSVEHAHPIVAAHMHDSAFFPHHPEMIFWPVEQEGLLMHVLALAPLIFRPDLLRLSPTHMLVDPPDKSRLHYVTDSDKLYMVSLTELAKDIDWYCLNRPLNPSSVADWWLFYDSPANDLLARTPFRLHFAESTEAKWRRAELRARMAIRRLIAARELWRIATKARELGCHRVAQLLSFAVQTGLAHRIITSAKPHVIQLPTDEALASMWEQRDFIFAESNRRALTQFLRSHCIQVRQVDENEIDAGGVVTLARGPGSYEIVTTNRIGGSHNSRWPSTTRPRPDSNDSTESAPASVQT
jgi:hypothetical protein